METRSVTKAATAVTGTNRQYVSDAKKIQSTSPETLEQVRTGRINIPEAKSILLSYLWASFIIGELSFGNPDAHTNPCHLDRLVHCSTCHG